MGRFLMTLLAIFFSSQISNALGSIDELIYCGAYGLDPHHEGEPCLVMGKYYFEGGDGIHLFIFAPDSNPQGVQSMGINARAYEKNKDGSYDCTFHGTESIQINPYGYYDNMPDYVFFNFEPRSSVSSIVWEIEYIVRSDYMPSYFYLIYHFSNPWPGLDPNKYRQ